MRLGVLKEPDDARVAIVPQSVKKFAAAGFEVQVETGAGAGAFYADAAYAEAGATVVSRSEILAGADMILGIAPPADAELEALRAGVFVVAMFNPLGNQALVDKLKSLPIKPFSLDRIPRITIAQSMDILSSQASLAGYKAVLMAANYLPSYFPMLMTAAGTIPPARVLILGAGVAGLQAIATARRLGATVEAFDVRSAVKEEVESLGAKFVEVEGAREEQSAGGYAVQQTEDYQRRQRALIHERASRADVIITTASIPGRQAPLLIEQATVEAMRPGSVIVDLAASSGGNCALTQNKQIIQHQGVTIIGDSNLPGGMARDASILFGNNVLSFLKYVFPGGKPEVDYSTEIAKGTYFGQ
ncbi:MAG: Re/Si-specific NAD(P)(+) transhydrogenase subunit alpha [Bacteroidia bacterium]